MFVILEKLIELICDELGYDGSEVDENTVLSDLVSDELEKDELIQALENEFEIEFAGGISGDVSVAELAEMIEKDS